MSEEIINAGELSCNNCPEQKRCNQQQKFKEQRINAILSYIANKDNTKYITSLKNEIPSITRCDVVFEKQLKRLEQENERLQEENKRLQMLSCANCGEQHLSPDGAELYEKNVQLKAENEQLKALCDTYFTCYRAKHNDIEGNLFSYRKALEEIKEVLKLYADSWVDEKVYPNLHYDNTKAKEDCRKSMRC